LVGLATTTPAARQTITLDPQNQNSSTPAVVLEGGQSTGSFSSRAMAVMGAASQIGTCSGEAAHD
jgi:hypothetical protein